MKFTLLRHLPCGCTENHVGLCPVALALWGKIAGIRDGTGKLMQSGLWSKYSRDPIGYHDVYFAATAEFLAHFEGNPVTELML